MEQIMFHGHLDYFQKSPLVGRPNIKPGDHGTLNAHNHYYIIFYYVWGFAWLNIYWNSIWLRVQSRMTSHYTWVSVTTLHDFGGVLGWPLDTFIWALTMSWSRLLARVWSSSKIWTQNRPYCVVWHRLIVYYKGIWSPTRCLGNHLVYKGLKDNRSAPSSYLLVIIQAAWKILQIKRKRRRNRKQRSENKGSSWTCQFWT